MRWLSLNQAEGHKTKPRHRRQFKRMELHKISRRQSLQPKPLQPQSFLQFVASASFNKSVMNM
jgi:hypothetical protein